VLLPDIQGLRALLRALAAHTRADIAEGKVDEAIERITVGMAIADHVGKTPFRVIKMWQGSVVDSLLDRVDELVQLEKCPNLYWAIAQLPSPLIDLRPVADWERRMLLSSHNLRERLETASTRDEWKQLAADLTRVSAEVDQEFAKLVEEPAGVRSYWKELATQAREELPKIKPELAPRMAEMSDTERAVRWFAARQARREDDGLAVFFLPPVAGLAYAKDWKVRERADRELRPRFVEVMALPPWTYVRAWSTQRRLAALQCLEAIRDHAARHKGKLPARLADIDAVPVPMDPMTGKPFDYELDADGARLSAASTGVYPSIRDQVRYRIRLRK
jgi:hypothetical protein